MSVCEFTFSCSCSSGTLWPSHHVPPAGKVVRRDVQPKQPGDLGDTGVLQLPLVQHPVPQGPHQLRPAAVRARLHGAFVRQLPPGGHTLPLGGGKFQGDQQDAALRVGRRLVAAHLGPCHAFFTRTPHAVGCACA